jgi:hypothetical protein
MKVRCVVGLTLGHLIVQERSKVCFTLSDYGVTRENFTVSCWRTNWIFSLENKWKLCPRWCIRLSDVDKINRSNNLSQKYCLPSSFQYLTLLIPQWQNPKVQIHWKQSSPLDMIQTYEGKSVNRFQMEVKQL